MYVFLYRLRIFIKIDDKCIFLVSPTLTRAIYFEVYKVEMSDSEM